MATTSTSANSGIDICSRALILIGANPITSFDDGTTESTVAVNLYEDIARSALTNTRWRFATEQAVLNTLSDVPTGRWDMASQLPSDLLMLHGITINDILVDYQLYGNKVFSNQTSADVMIADYTYRANEIDWPSYFTLAVEYSIAVVFATAIARDAPLATLMQTLAERSMAKARNLDSQQSTTAKLTTSRFIIERRS
tara:strand:+ start:64 stop:657 length:594 start_codon:yes stop_codon:yes gene_type:complete